jgi:predicted RNA-binding Zn-ribbon protein involved in translation (DUF1610 family)
MRRITRRRFLKLSAAFGLVASYPVLIEHTSSSPTPTGSRSLTFLSLFRVYASFSCPDCGGELPVIVFVTETKSKNFAPLAESK